MTKMEEIPKEHLSLAGEYAVASELCRMGIYAQLTLGTRKKTDILVDTGTAMLRIQVKAKQIRGWTCRGIFGNDIVLVLVDYKNKGLEQRPDFYILTSRDWDKYVRWFLSDYINAKKVTLDKENCPIWSAHQREGRGIYKGCNVFPEDIVEHKEQWGKIKALLKKRK